MDLLARRKLPRSELEAGRHRIGALIRYVRASGVAVALLGPLAGGHADGLDASAEIALEALPDIAKDDLSAAFAAFRTSCQATERGIRPPRAAQAPPAALSDACRRALALPSPLGQEAAQRFFAGAFTVRRLPASAFFTGYYEPVVDGSLRETPLYRTPLLEPPDDLVPQPSGSIAMRRQRDGSLVPMPDRVGIEAGALGATARPLVWLREPVDAYFVQIQGSARVRLPDGSLRRVAYAGRNGYSYTGIGKMLVDTLHIPPERMGMADLRAWIRAHGQGPQDAGTALMRSNRSYIFFRFDDTLAPEAGPVGAEGVSLAALRSLAVDRTRWSYGLPFYLDADLPWQGELATPFRRMMVAQDTGAAIVGPARADIFFGSGEAAAVRAGAIRQSGTLYVLWPKEPLTPQKAAR